MLYESAVDDVTGFFVTYRITLILSGRLIGFMGKLYGLCALNASYWQSIAYYSLSAYIFQYGRFHTVALFLASVQHLGGMEHHT